MRQAGSRSTLLSTVLEAEQKCPLRLVYVEVFAQGFAGSASNQSCRPALVYMLASP
jgi:hypothetical protein